MVRTKSKIPIYSFCLVLENKIFLITRHTMLHHSQCLFLSLQFPTSFNILLPGSSNVKVIPVGPSGEIPLKTPFWISFIYLVIVSKISVTTLWLWLQRLRYVLYKKFIKVPFTRTSFFIDIYSYLKVCLRICVVPIPSDQISLPYRWLRLHFHGFNENTLSLSRIKVLQWFYFHFRFLCFLYVIFTECVNSHFCSSAILLRQSFCNKWFP